MEQNYLVTEKELLAMVWAFAKLHPYLQGTDVIVQIDHHPLIPLTKKKDLSRMFNAADILDLQDCCFQMTYTPG